MRSTRTPITLDTLDLHRPMRVVSLSTPAGAPEWPVRLEEIGFWPGELVSVLARGLPGNDPLVVRVGDSTFALRCEEAACVTVETVNPSAKEGKNHA
ncbi:FeoA family protein [Paucibacter sp. PLA-PC-4]|uniref:FeoA family protein n=1 Tax=Paucibacter sp. PLA-PC-4 TaxID=2993655 RepID=UPI00224A7A64|nr:FeoA family protein [Paucibacter sp. PLA-PC-4]MCX2865430.1 FeoA family protein [Paucibacter sp. PLA-PC-4]